MKNGNKIIFILRLIFVVVLVADKKLGKAITEKLGINCTSNEQTFEIFRGLRAQLNSLVTGKEYY